MADKDIFFAGGRQIKKQQSEVHRRTREKLAQSTDVAPATNAAPPTTAQEEPEEDWIPDWLEDSASWAYDKAGDAAGYVGERFDDLLDWGEETIDDVIAGYQSMTSDEKKQFLLDIIGVTEAQALLNDPANADILQTGLFIASFTPWGKGLKVLRALNKVRKLGKARKAKGFVPHRGGRTSFKAGKERPYNPKTDIRINSTILNEMRENALHDFLSTFSHAIRQTAMPVGYGALEGTLAYIKGERDPIKILLSVSSGIVTGLSDKVWVSFVNSFITTFLQEMEQALKDAAKFDRDDGSIENLLWQAFKAGAWAAGTAIIVGHTKTRISHFPEWQQDLIEVALNTFGPTVLSKLVPPILGTLYEGSKAVGKSVKEMAGDVGEQASHFYDQISHPRSPKDK